MDAWLIISSCKILYLGFKLLFISVGVRNRLKQAKSDGQTLHEVHANKSNSVISCYFLSLCYFVKYVFLFCFFLISQFHSVLANKNVIKFTHKASHIS